MLIFYILMIVRHLVSFVLIHIFIFNHEFTGRAYKLDYIERLIVSRLLLSVPVCRAAERFVIVALCSFAFLLNLYLTFTLCCLSGKI